MCMLEIPEFRTGLGQHEIAVELRYSIYIIIFKTVLLTLNVGILRAIFLRLTSACAEPQPSSFNFIYAVSDQRFYNQLGIEIPRGELTV